MPAIIPAEFRLEFQWNTSGMPAIIPAEFWLEFQWNTGGMPAIIPAEFRLKFQWNAGNNLAEFRLEMSRIPGEYRQNATLRTKSRKIGMYYALPDWKILTAMFQRKRPRKWPKPTRRRNETFYSRTSLKSKLEILNEL